MVLMCFIYLLIDFWCFFWVDFIGLLTALHYECVVDDADGLVPVAKLELTDERFDFFPLCRSCFGVFAKFTTFIFSCA